jgi:energy-coupling factor transporter ATP-binding protein EcfA2
VKVSVDLEYCHGIKAMNYTFDFTDGNIILVYAPNGSMKTSLAKVFRDLSKSEAPRDHRYLSRKPKCEVRDDSGNELNPLHILVVDSYDDSYHSERVSMLLVNSELQKKYESEHKAIEDAKRKLLAQIGEISQTKKTTEQLLLSAFGEKVKDASSLLAKLEKDVSSPEYDFSDIRYLEVISEKTEAFLKLPETRALLGDYLKKYNEIISKSDYFRKGGFNPYNASTISKTLKNHNYFAAKHSLLLYNTANKPEEIKSQIDLEKAISEQMNRVLNNAELLDKFNSIKNKIDANTELRDFQKYLLQNMTILPELADVDVFKKKLWISYLAASKVHYQEFLAVFKKGEKEIEEIIKTAKNQETRWREVVNVFKTRFFVPFEIHVTNQSEVILNNTAPTFSFEFIDGNDSCVMDQESLPSTLCTGEQRALYILNIIYEVQAREKEPFQTFLILDDIADSFDYKNKFAIIEYIKDISQSNKFLIIILTHNFDFYRTVQSRLGVKRQHNCLMSIKTDTHVTLAQAEYLNPFEAWKKSLNNDKKMLLASIPMVRNLIEYTRGQEDEKYKKLTSILHQKDDSATVTLADLAQIFKETLSLDVNLGAGTVLPLIFQVADECLDTPESVNLENKVILSIAIRLKAESIMIQRINDATLTSSIKGEQTGNLFDLFKKRFPGDTEAIKILERVVMMTPEPIHLNSFMFEPLVDISDQHLKELYKAMKDFPQPKVLLAQPTPM